MEISLREVVVSSNTGLDAIRRAPIVEEDTGVKCIRIGDISQKKDFGLWGNTKVSSNDYSKFQLKKNDILIARTGATIGVNIFIKKELNAVYNNGLIRLRIDENKAYPKFIYYVLNTREYWGRINAVSSATVAQPNMKMNDLLDYKFDLPPLVTQRKIASILSTIDDKIELNNQMNENLEEEAMAIFREWFINNPESENWEDGHFADLIFKTLGGDWGKESPAGNNTEMVYCVRGADIPEVKNGNKGKMPYRYILPKNYQNKKLKDGDLVVEISGGSPTQSTGRICAISQTLLDRYDHGMVCTNFCRAVTPKDGYSMFIYHYWQYLYNTGLFFNYENGTTGIKNFDMTGFTTVHDIKIPDKELVDKFNEVCGPIYDKIYSNGLQNEQLAGTRDTLLPKLMSGEIDVDAIEL